MKILYKQNTFSIDVNGEWVQIVNPGFAEDQCWRNDRRITDPIWSLYNWKTSMLKDGDTFEVDGIWYTLKCENEHACGTPYCKPQCQIERFKTKHPSAIRPKLAILHLIEQPKVEQVEEKKDFALYNQAIDDVIKKFEPVFELNPSDISTENLIAIFGRLHDAYDGIQKLKKK